mmetsp:Transcript_39110/g.116172  ORF Transcript_39110/g.116172 Transcript_39110/m.116172 type:complete len:324 (-) Transcript_39110:61-1032(-)
MRVPAVHVPGVDGPAVLQGACQAGGDLSQRGATGRRRRRGARHPPDHLDGNDERLLRGAHAPHGRQAARLDLRRRRQTPLLLGPSGHGRASCRPPPHPHRRARSDLRLVLPPVVPDGLPGRVRAGHRLCPSQAPRRPAAAGRASPTLWAGAGRRGASLWRPHPLELCLRRRPRQRVARDADGVAGRLVRARRAPPLPRRDVARGQGAADRAGRACLGRQGRGGLEGRPVRVRCGRPDTVRGAERARVCARGDAPALPRARGQAAGARRRAHGARAAVVQRELEWRPTRRDAPPRPHAHPFRRRRPPLPCPADPQRAADPALAA